MLFDKDTLEYRAALEREALFDEINSLSYFAEAVWRVVEPTEPFQPGWHIDAICEHLEACVAGDIKALIINMPPRHMKSTLVSVLFPAWVWLRFPEKRWLFSSYAANLSKRDSVKCRRLIESQKYLNRYKPKFTLSKDQNEKNRFDNSATGYRIATSVGGSGTGEGGDFIIVDDPHKAGDIASETKRNSVLEWWDEEMSSRLNNPKTGCKIIVMQRLHEKDLSGHLLKKGGWEHLCLPAEYEPKRTMKPTSIGWTDPRQNEGDLLWPNRFDKNWIDGQKKDMGSMAASGQLQQNPTASDGGLFKRHWWKYYQVPPKKFLRVVQFWDCAQKAGITNDYSVCATWGKTESGYFLLDLWRKKVEAPQLEAAAQNQFARFKPDTVMIEDKSSGSSLIQHLRQKTTLPVIAYDPKARDKEVRASAATPTVEAGNCFLPMGADFVEEFITEHEKFPLGEHDDQVDTTSMMVEYFNSTDSIEPRIRSL